jgi:hypothetical protein
MFGEALHPVNREKAGEPQIFLDTYMRRSADQGSENTEKVAAPWNEHIPHARAAHVDRRSLTLSP